jgi:hypothetical protein
MKRIIMVGRGSKAGAWPIRGDQLGTAIGAQVLNDGLANANLVGVDLAVIVKRIRPEDLARLHAAGTRIVWDIIDAWPQPIGNWWARDVCVKWLRDEFRRIKPSAVVATTQCMEADCAKFGVPVLVLPHHARPHMARAPLRLEIKRVGYEGGLQYLGSWAAILHKACAARGWLFETNPPALTELDVVVAIREQNGYAAKNWKSNIKLANAQGCGIPCVLNRERAYLETACGGELWADDAGELAVAFDTLQEMDGRLELTNKLYSSAPRIEQLSETYRQWLEQL